MTRILLAGDDPAVLAAATALGLEVEVATLESAPSRLAARPELIVVFDDLAGGGVELVARIRERAPDAVAAFVAARPDDATRRRLTVELATFVVDRPIDATSLITSLVTMRAQRSQASAPPGFAQQLLELRRDFAAKLPAKLEALTAAARAASQDLGRVASARALAHRLCGSAGSYGHPRLGEAIGVVEDLLEAAERSATPPSWQELESALSDAAAWLGREGAPR